MFRIFNSLRVFQLHSLPSHRVLSQAFAISKPKNTLFDRLGGEVTLNRVLDVFHAKVSNDKNLSAFFKEFLPQFREHQRKTLMIAFGDPSGYATRDIKSFHSVSHIKEKDWEVYIGYLKESLGQIVSDKDSVNESVAIVEKFRKVVVEKTVFEKINKNVQMISDSVGNLFDRLLTDVETRDFFLNHDVLMIKRKLTDYLVNILGGSNKVTYKDMRSAHKVLDLNDRHFYIFKKHLNDALRLHGFTHDIIDEILFIVEKRRVEVLNREKPYEKVGYEVGVAKIVDRMYELIPENPLLKSFFEDVDIDKVKEGQRRFISGILGGPKYIGKDMKSIHGKMNLADAHFDAFKGCFETALREIKLNHDDIRDCTYQFEKQRRLVCSISLYELLGGEPSVMRIVHVMAKKMRENEHLKVFYDKADDSEMKATLRAEIMHTLGGPLSFRERDIKSAHQGLFITKELFREYKSLLFLSMKEIGVVDNLIVQVIRILENKSGLVIAKENKEDLKRQNII